MKTTRIFIASAIALLSLSACTQEEALDIQGLNAPGSSKSEEYYASIREWKKGPHVLSFGFYTAWHALEGSEGEVASPSSYGQRLVGLPDSLDIVDLWMGIPAHDPSDTIYGLERNCPVTIADMKFCQEKLGTKFVSHEDMSHNQVFTWGTWIDENGEEHPMYYNILQGRGTNAGRATHQGFADKMAFDSGWKSSKVLLANGESVQLKAPSMGYDENHPVGGSKGLREACIAYARRSIERMKRGHLDGVDFDYEPNDNTWTNETAAYVAEECSYYIGPKKWGEGYDEAKDFTKLLMFNFFGGNPGAGVEPYSDYIINQCYAWQIGAEPSSWVGRKPDWCPKEKFILNDSIGGEAQEGYLYGGKPSHYEVNGVDCKMFSMEAMARLVKDQGFAGFGAYYLDRNYMSASGIPYRELRRDICIANGADLAPYFVE